MYLTNTLKKGNNMKACVEIIEALIEKRYFNKEYLV